MWDIGCRHTRYAIVGNWVSTRHQSHTRYPQLMINVGYWVLTHEMPNCEKNHTRYLHFMIDVGYWVSTHTRYPIVRNLKDKLDTRESNRKEIKKG